MSKRIYTDIQLCSYIGWIVFEYAGFMTGQHVREGWNLDPEADMTQKLKSHFQFVPCEHPLSTKIQSHDKEQGWMQKIKEDRVIC